MLSVHWLRAASPKDLAKDMSHKGLRWFRVQGLNSFEGLYKDYIGNYHRGYYCKDLAKNMEALVVSPDRGTPM